MRYLLILEDNSLRTAAELIESDYESAADGYLTLIDMQTALEWDANAMAWKCIPETEI